MFNLFKKIFQRNPKINQPETTPPTTPRADTGRRPPRGQGVYLTQFAFDVKWQIMEARVDTIQTILIVVLIALVVSYITLWFGYFQFASTSFNDYSQKAKELNDRRYQDFNARLNTLENATRSSKIKGP